MNKWIISITATWPLCLKKTKYNPNLQIKINHTPQSASMIKKQIFTEYLQRASQHLILWEACRAYGLKEFNFVVRMF